jgi:hypothetical protein
MGMTGCCAWYENRSTAQWKRSGLTMIVRLDGTRAREVVGHSDAPEVE